MRSFLCLMALFLACLLATSVTSDSWAKDYNARFMRNYPPGYYGMWYYAKRFFEIKKEGKQPEEDYRWDKYMTRITGMIYPFYPIPHGWDYGNYRKFNLPDYNSNDWH
ncbi:hypothetical protein ACFL2Q_08865 [Thermodesulfobacteriota bacterium]